jgi:hypothetical protein
MQAFCHCNFIERIIMRLINTKAHGIYDYLLVIILLTAAHVFEYQTGSKADVANQIVAVYILCTSLITNFEMGIFRKLPLKVHLYLDTLAGAFLAASPWLLNFTEITYKPQLVFGLSMIFVSVLTDRIPAKQVLAMMGKGKAARKIEAIKQKENFPGFKFIHDSTEFSVVRTVKKHLGLHKI